VNEVSSSPEEVSLTEETPAELTPEEDELDEDDSSELSPNEDELAEEIYSFSIWGSLLTGELRICCGCTLD